VADDRAQIADQASTAAGWAYRAGEHVKASRLLNVARAADPSRAPLWAVRAARVHAAAREQAAKVAGPDDVRPLGEIVAARPQAARIGADDQAVRFARAWNAERQAAAAAQEPQADAEPAQPGPEALPDLLDGPEAGQ
jgi:hypothetical protein